MRSLILALCFGVSLASWAQASAPTLDAGTVEAEIALSEGMPDPLLPPDGGAEVVISTADAGSVLTDSSGPIENTAPPLALGPDAGTPAQDLSSDDAPPATTVVTATRLPRPLRDVPSTVIVLPREELNRSPGLTLDAVARTVPSVATFRRSTSLFSDPTSQGLNLRAVGPSGVSRALVLLDGAPLSDAFGGWVYWGAVPRLELDRVEVAPGPSSALYGSSALGGVLQLITRRPTESGFEGEVLVGSHRTAQAAVRGAYVFSRGALSLDAEHLTSAGYVLLAPHRAGLVDVPAGGTNTAVAAHLHFDPTGQVRLRSRFGYFDQAQKGGTQFTTADVRRFDLSANVDAALPAGHSLSGSLLFRWGTFEQQRARVADERETEVLASEQVIPTREVAAAGGWASGPLSLLGEHRLSAGADVRYVRGTSFETLHPASTASSALVGRDSGGEQLFGGVHLQDEYTVTPELQLVGSVRFDGWSNFNGEQRLRRRDGSLTETTFDTATASAFSPRLGILYRPVPMLALKASGGSAFRAPTLNELYRPFQVGTIRTAANAELGPERLWGAELGAELQPLTALSLRVTGFWNSLADPVTNVTLATPLPDGSERQRQNLGEATVRGLEAWIDYRPWRPLTLTGAYTWSDAVVSASPGQPELLGNRLPHAPEHRVTAAASFHLPSWLTAQLQLRYAGAQFEDDLNERPLASVYLVDVSASREIGDGVEFFAAVENVFDRRYLVGRAGVDTFGAPRTFRAGVRLRQNPSKR